MWRQIEADFRRDYGIRLPEQLESMSWRRFCVLLMGLSPGGCFARDAGRLLRRDARAEAESEQGFIRWLTGAG